jgi:hypothetical protein
MRQTFPTVGPGSCLVDFEAEIDHERLYTKGQNDNEIGELASINRTAFGGCGLISHKSIGYEPNSAVTLQLTVGGLYTNCSVPLSDEPTSNALSEATPFRTGIVFVEDDRNVPAEEKTHLMLFRAQFTALAKQVLLINPLSSGAQTNKIFDHGTRIDCTIQPLAEGEQATQITQLGFVGFRTLLTDANLSVTVLGRNVPIFARLRVFNNQRVLLPPRDLCRLVSDSFVATPSILSNLNLSLAYELEFLPNPP